MNTLISVDNTWMLFAIMAAIAAAAIWLEQTYKWAAKLSSCVICLLIAMLLSNCRVIPTDAGAYDFVWSYVVPLSIPLLLYKANIRKIWRESGRMLGDLPYRKPWYTGRWHNRLLFTASPTWHRSCQISCFDVRRYKCRGIGKPGSHV